MTTAMGDILHALCKRLGHNPEDVIHLSIHPDHVFVSMRVPSLVKESSYAIKEEYHSISTEWPGVRRCGSVWTLDGAREETETVRIT